MASLRKKPNSPYWFACFTLPDGRRVQRSTKETARKPAQRLADEWERLSKERAKARQAHAVVAEIYRAAHKEELPDATPRAFIAGWLARRSGEIAAASWSAYESASRRFLDWLGQGADGPLAELETRHFVRFRDAQAERVAPVTVNKLLKLLRVIFEDARRDGFISENPAKDCPRLRDAVKSASESRRPFTVNELRQILAVADDEWRSLILFGFYTGQRLGDLARLTWANIDLTSDEVHLTTRKTGRTVHIPLSADLRAHIATLPAGDDPAAPLHPRAARRSMQANSNQFADLLATAGLIPPRDHRDTGKGRATRRTPSIVSFHSIRHTATSLMKNAGVSSAVVMDLIGHESPAISAAYTHIDSPAKRSAIDKLPDLVRE